MLFSFQKQQLPPLTTPLGSSSQNFVELYQKQSEVVVGQQRDIENLQLEVSRLRAETFHLQGIVDTHTSSVMFFFESYYDDSLLLISE